MKRTDVMITLGVLILLLTSLWAAAPPVPTLLLPPMNNLSVVEIKPVALPTSAGVAVTATTWLDMVTLTNTTGGALTVTISDRQTSPVVILPTVSIPANTLIVVQFGGTRMDGGFTWVASGSGVNGYFRGRQVR